MTPFPPQNGNTQNLQWNRNSGIFPMREKRSHNFFARQCPILQHYLGKVMLAYLTWRLFAADQQVKGAVGMWLADQPKQSILMLPESLQNCGQRHYVYNERLCKFYIANDILLTFLHLFFWESEPLILPTFLHPLWFKFYSSIVYLSAPLVSWWLISRIIIIFRFVFLSGGIITWKQPHLVMSNLIILIFIYYYNRMKAAKLTIWLVSIRRS